MSNDWLKKTQIDRFESVADFLERACDLSKHGHHKGRGSFSGGETYRESHRLATAGRHEIVPRAEKVISDLELSGIISRGAPLYGLDVAGAFPSVPAYLVGQPENMFTRQASNAASDRAPLTVYLDVAVSAGINAKQVEERGVALLAMIMALSETRPVDLCLYATLGATGGGAIFPIVRVETRPLDIAAATYAMSSAGFLRNLIFEYANAKSPMFDGKWAWHGDPRQDTFRARVREVLGATDNDLVIYGGHLQDEHIANPIRWTRAQIELRTRDAA